LKLFPLFRLEEKQKETLLCFPPPSPGQLATSLAENFPLSNDKERRRLRNCHGPGSQPEVGGLVGSSSVDSWQLH